MLRDINIRPALNGFIVQCGCQTIVFETVDKLVDNLRDYLRDPDRHEKTFMAAGINRKHTHPDQPVCNAAWPSSMQGVMGTDVTFPSDMTSGGLISAGVTRCDPAYANGPVCNTSGTAP